MISKKREIYFLSVIAIVSVTAGAAILFSKEKSAVNKICIMPVGKISIHLIQDLKEPVEKAFGIPVSRIDGFADIEFAYNRAREQYFAPLILMKMKDYFPDDASRLVGITDKDLYERGLNFIFGEASGKICIVSSNRFRPCTTINTEQEKNILLERMIKTVIHELGHTFGLRHCDNKRCVIFFSNWLGDTDTKTRNFCDSHKQQLEKAGIITENELKSDRYQPK